MKIKSAIDKAQDSQIESAYSQIEKNKAAIDKLK